MTSASSSSTSRGLALSPTGGDGFSGSAKLLNRANIRSRASSSLGHDIDSSASTKNVVVLGGSYGGMHAASVLAQRLPPSHRVILIERNSHFNHLYVFPRFSTLPGHEHKAFIPYQSIFKEAPKRPTRRGATGRGAAMQEKTPLSGDDRSRARSAQPTIKAQDTLGMGSMVREGSSSSTSSSTAASKSSRHRQSSSESRSSSDSQHDKDSLLSARTTATSLSSSYAEASSEKPSPVLVQERQAAAGKDAGNRAVEQAIATEAQSGIIRQEEDFGRPEIQVESLEGALDKGLDLEEDADTVKEDVASGFEESSAHVVLQATVTSLTPTHVVVQSNEAAAADRIDGGKKLWSIDSVSIPYSHMVYALGSFLPDPLRTEARSKNEGMSWMREIQSRIKGSQEIVLVGGGALGVEYATDIKSVHPDKKVTLIHSRKQLLPNFDEKVHDVALQRLQELGVNVVLGERLALMEGCPRGSSISTGGASGQPAVCTPGDAKGEGARAHQEGICVGDGRKKVKTTGGKEFECDLLLLCTGQQPNSSLMAQLSPTSVDSRTRLIRVLRTLQVQTPNGKDGMAPMPFDPTPPCGDCDCFLDKKAEGVDGASLEGEVKLDDCLSNVYAIGDVADAFGALNAGYQAWNMADVAAENILRDIDLQSKSSTPTIEEERHTALQHYTPVGNMLKLSLGLGKMVFQGLPEEGGDGKPVVEMKEDPDDLAVEGVWQFMAGMSTDDMYL